MLHRRWLFLLLGCVLPGVVGELYAQNNPLPTYSLEECLNLALRQNPEILAAQKQIEAASGGVIEAKAGFYPNAQINGGYLYREPGFTHDPNRRAEEWNLSIRVTQNLYSGGSVRAQVALSKLTEDSRLQDYRVTVDRILEQVRTNFYDILQAEATAAVREQSVGFYEGEVSRQQNKIEAGMSNRRDLLRAQVSLANERPLLIDARTGVKNSYLSLCEVLGLSYLLDSDQVPFRIKGTLDYNPLKLDLAQLVRDAESRRPEVKVRQNDIESARQQATIVRAPVLPRVDAFVSYESLNETSKSAPQDIDHGYVVGLNGTWQIFDGFASAGRVKAARALESVARSSREALVLAVQTQVLSAYYKLQQAEATIASQANTVTLAQEALVLSESSFAAGLGTQLDVLTSRLELTRARTVELNARHDYLVASAQLQRAVSSDYQWLDQPLKVPAPAPVIPTVLPPATQAQLTPEVPARNPAVEPPNALFLRPGSGETRLRLNPDPS